MRKLTAKKVKDTLPRKKEYKLHDGDGLFLRVRPSGAKSWLFSFNLPTDRKLIRMTLGSVKNISLKEARKMLPDLHKQVSQNIDPRRTRLIIKNTKIKLTFHPLEKNDIDAIVSAFTKMGWHKPKTIYENYFKEQLEGLRSIFLARHNENFCGYVTIKWESDYGSFAKKNIPEISDLNVLSHYRNHGVGTALINQCEMTAKKRGYKKIGLGVGLTKDYGNAQRLYIHLGYIFDGHGLHYKCNPLNYGSQATIDDDLVLFLIKDIYK